MRHKSQRPMTAHQSGVAACLLDAMSDYQISRAMGHSQQAVERHIRNLKDRFGARNRVDLALKLAEVARAPEVAA